MSAYVIVDIEITDPKEYEEYKKLSPISLAAYGGKFVVRGGQAETLEGDWPRGRIVVLEFSDVERAKQWWGSPEYADAKAIRHRTAKTKMIVVEGFHP
ncbi:DUF1330 domain-containing protein [bacterium]|nr:DUF1330 domain-containing protein [bacterium]